MKIVTINGDYITYLRQFDDRVCFNKEWQHTRPYVGIIFSLRGHNYFAPLTSSGKGAKLINNPKTESTTFFPINNCEYGGVNINNMIPVVDGVYTEINYAISKTDSDKDRKYKILIIKQLEVLNTNEKLLREKANRLYSMKTQGRLYPNYDNITCDFKLLEKKANEYKILKTFDKSKNKEYYNSRNAVAIKKKNKVKKQINI